jgi:hypothetical protein
VKLAEKLPLNDACNSRKGLPARHQTILARDKSAPAQRTETGIRTIKSQPERIEALVFELASSLDRRDRSEIAQSGKRFRCL